MVGTMLTGPAGRSACLLLQVVRLTCLAQISNSIRFDATTLHIPYPYPTAMSAAAPVTLWLLKYDYVPDILDKRVPHRCVEWLWAIVRWPKAYRRIDLIKLPPHRAAHIGGLQKAAQEGTLVLGA